jgi:hypothetical protein
MKIYYQGRRYNGRFDSFRAFVRRVVRLILWTLGISFVGGLLFTLGAVMFSTTSIAVDQSVQVVQAAEQEAPILSRIADAESGNCKKGGAHQFNADGTIVTHTNGDGSVDVGKFQINMSADHIREMAKLGFNPLTEEGNAAYAKYLYDNRGTGPWASSAKCWAR